MNVFVTACQWILYVAGRTQSKSHIQFISGSVQYILQLMTGLRSAHTLSADVCAFVSRVFTPYPSHHSFIHSFISIQPYRPGWQEPEPSHVTGMALPHCILGKYLGVVCHCFPPPLDVPTFASKCLYVRNDARDPSSERWNYLGEKHSR